MHGGQSDEEKYVMFAACGKTVVNGMIGEMETRDIAGIVLFALGCEQPDTWTARVPSGLFEGVQAKERPIYEMPYDKPQRIHEVQPTPDKGNSIMNLIGRDRILAYLPLDEDIADITGNLHTEIMGKLYFVDGYYGHGAQLVDGGIAMNNYTMKKESFTIAFWLKTGSVTWSDCFRYLDEEKKCGYKLVLTIGHFRLILMDGEREIIKNFQLPYDYLDGWVHVTMAVDWESEEIRFSYDFEKFIIEKIPQEINKKPFTECCIMKIGQTRQNDVRGLYAVLDDFLLLDEPLQTEGLRQLAEYYGY